MGPSVPAQTSVPRGGWKEPGLAGLLGLRAATMLVEAKCLHKCPRPAGVYSGPLSTRGYVGSGVMGHPLSWGSPAGREANIRQAIRWVGYPEGEELCSRKRATGGARAAVRGWTGLGNGAGAAWALWGGGVCSHKAGTHCWGPSTTVDWPLYTLGCWGSLVMLQWVVGADEAQEVRDLVGAFPASGS